MGQKDLNMIGESVLKNPERWADILASLGETDPKDELKKINEMIDECEKYDL